MKRLLVLLLTFILIIGLSGCMVATEDIAINKDGSGHITSNLLFERESYELIRQTAVEQGYQMVDFFEGQKPEITEIDGIEYYYTTETEEFDTLDELEELLEEAYDNVYVSENGVRYAVQNEMEMSYAETQAIYGELGVDLKEAVTGIIRITMPEPIIKYSKGGEISEDGLSVTFLYDFEQLCQPQDIMVSTAKETVKPSMSVTHKKTYKNAKTVTVSDASGIKEAKYKKKGGEYTAFALSHTFTKNGTYTVTAKDYYGNKRTRTFTLKDETKPVVKGVKNKKTYTEPVELYFSDNCGVSSVTVYMDGVKSRVAKELISEGLLLVSAADYKVYVKDINGNSRTVRFTIE